MAEFTWTPDFKSNNEKSPNVKVIKFGDGYEQRQANGMNSNPRKISVTFNQRSVSEIDEIDDFLIARNSVESFDWTPPRDGVPGKFVCRSWRRVDENASYDSLSGTFEEVFEP